MDIRPEPEMSMDMLVVETHTIVVQLRADFDEARRGDVAWKDDLRKVLWGGNGLKEGLVAIVRGIEKDYAAHVITAEEGFKRLGAVETAIADVRAYVTARRAAEEAQRKFWNEVIKVGGTRLVQVIAGGTFGGVMLNVGLSFGRAFGWWH